MNSFNKKELVLLRKLNTPAKVQDFLNTIPFNFEHNKIDTIKSPLRVLREMNCHCIEGAIFSAHVLSLHGYKPRLVHLKTTSDDMDHVITIFKQDGLLGAISKTNHSVLRYRDPVYKTLRELVMSYFHEYFLNNGNKTLRQYSTPLDLNIFERGWEVEMEDLWGIDEELDNIKHYDIFPKNNLKNLRKAEKIETEAAKLIEYKPR